MTRDEFSSMLDTHLLSYFPELKGYMAKMPDDTRLKWAEMFEGTDKRDFRLAMDEYTRGMVNLPFNRDELASKLLKMSRRHLNERMDSERRQTQRAEIAQMVRPVVKREKRAEPTVGRSAMAGALARADNGNGDCVRAFEEIMKRVDDGEELKLVQDDMLGRLREKWANG